MKNIVFAFLLIVPFMTDAQQRTTNSFTNSIGDSLFQFILVNREIHQDGSFSQKTTGSPLMKKDQYKEFLFQIAQRNQREADRKKLAEKRINKVDSLLQEQGASLDSLTQAKILARIQGDWTIIFNKNSYNATIQNDTIKVGQKTGTIRVNNPTSFTITGILAEPVTINIDDGVGELNGKKVEFYRRR